MNFVILVALMVPETSNCNYQQTAAMINMVMFLVHDSASRITKFIDQGYSFIVTWCQITSPTQLCSLHQEVPWQLAMNIGIEQKLEIVLPTQASYQQCAV